MITIGIDTGIATMGVAAADENHPDSSAPNDLIELAIKAFEKFAPKRFLAEERGAWLDVANKIQAGGEI